MSAPSMKPDVHAQIASAYTLASRFYTDPAMLALEKERIFRRTWQLVGTLSQPCGQRNGNALTIADPETFFTVDVAGEPVVLVRDKQGTLRAFSNVCRHRAGPIAQGCGSKNVLRCAYHGWIYTLDGRLIGTPDIDGVEFFDRSTMGMVPLRCETWEQFIFVNFDPAAEPLSAFLGNIPEQSRGFAFAGLQLVERRDYVIACNWKVYVDNYLEGYHIPIAHPGLMREIDYSQYHTETFRYYSQQFAPIRALKSEEKHAGATQTDTPAVSPQRPITLFAAQRSATHNAGHSPTNCHSERGEESAFATPPPVSRVYAPGTGTVKEALYFWIFPNLMLNIYPDNISTNLIVPLSHDKTLTIFEWFFHGAPIDECDSAHGDESEPALTRSPLATHHSPLSARIQRAVAFSDEVQQEDIALCEAVQRGLQSATYDRGRYSPKRENGVHHFHLLLAEFLARAS
jgi:choline monooxygenase